MDIDSDSSGYSQYGNISLENDIDMLKQRQPMITFSPPNNDVGQNELDNSDLIEQILTGGDTVFQPSHSFGVSTTTSATMNPMTLGGPSGIPYLDDESVYNSPTNGQINYDEKLAILQQHRGSIAKKAIDGHVRSTKNLFKKYFTNELDTAPTPWWDDDNNPESMETDFSQDVDIY